MSDKKKYQHLYSFDFYVYSDSEKSASIPEVVSSLRAFLKMIEEGEPSYIKDVLARMAQHQGMPGEAEIRH